MSVVNVEGYELIGTVNSIDEFRDIEVHGVGKFLFEQIPIGVSATFDRLSEDCGVVRLRIIHDFGSHVDLLRKLEDGVTRFRVALFHQAA